MTGSNRTINICFHGIGEPGRPLEPGEDHYWIGADQYREILDEIVTWPSVSISFDDGNDSDGEIGLEGLCERGLRATFFVLAGRIDQTGSLTRSQMREMVREGMSIGSHGMRHVPWSDLEPPDRHEELVEARSIIADAAGTPVREAACPLGRYNRSVLGDLKRLDYERVHTSDRTTAAPGDWIQPRYSVTRHDSAATLRDGILGRQSLRYRVRPRLAGLAKRIR